MTHSSTIPLSGGYEEVSHPHMGFLDEPPPPTVSFQHRDASNQVTQVWPSLYGVNEVIKGDLAIFVGDRAYVDPDRATHPRLFAVKAPGLPLDITDEVVLRWAKATGHNPKLAMRQFTLATPVENDDRIDIRLDFEAGDKWSSGRTLDWPDQATISMDWSQIDEIMKIVKAKGVTDTDLHWHTPYIHERF